MIKLPERFEQRMRKLLQSEYDAWRDSFQQEPASGLRTNRLKISGGGFRDIAPFPLKQIPWIENGFYWEPSEGMPAKHPYYYAGLYYIQEPSAMTPANLLPVEPGDRVLDLCAAPGGKSTELAAKLAGSGLLVSNDISPSRARALLKNLGVFGVRNSIILSEDPKNLVPVFAEYFDKILIDAPCSGEGMFRKDPSIMKNWEQYGVEYYHKLQKEILQSASKLLKPGGMLLYSTCTFSPEENEGSVQFLLDHSPEFSVVELKERYEGFDGGHPEWITGASEELRHCVRIWPQRMGGEGHFCALLKKTGQAPEDKDNAPSTSPGRRGKGGRGKTVRAGVEGRCTLTEQELDFLHLIGIDTDGDIRLFGDKLFLLPEGLPELNGLRALRSGLYLGDRKKNRFEPSQPLAMALTPDAVPDFLSLPADSREAVRYLKCESLDLGALYQAAGPAAKRDCPTLVGVDHYPLGWAKRTDGLLKNKYFPGWRWM